MRESSAQHRPEVVFHAAAYKYVAPDGAQPDRGGPDNALATGR